MWLGDPFVHFSVSCSLSQVFHHGSPRIFSPHSQGTSFPRHQIMPPLTILHSRNYHVSSTENVYATRSLPHFLPLFPYPQSSGLVGFQCFRMGICPRHRNSAHLKCPVWKSSVLAHSFLPCRSSRNVISLTT